MMLKLRSFHRKTIEFKSSVASIGSGYSFLKGVGNTVILTFLLATVGGASMGQSASNQDSEREESEKWILAQGIDSSSSADSSTDSSVNSGSGFSGDTNSQKSQGVEANESMASDSSDSSDNNYGSESRDSKEDAEKITVIGSRHGMSLALDSPVPVDVISGENFSMVNSTADITDNLNTLIPSYMATPATGDGSAFVRPTTLRGMAGDQTLVMVNGRRRHRSALVQLFAPPANNGSHGVDVAMIPSIALKEVQVLRDGASAQYGSDAIAGVMNFVLKDARQGSLVEASFGNHFEGETSWKIGANTGIGWGRKSFLNLSVDTNSNEALSRGHQRPNAPDAEGVGQDSPFDDAPFVQTWGRPETSGTRFAFNAMHELHNGMEVYTFGNLAMTTGRFRFFYRNPSHKSLTEGNSPSATNLDRVRITGFTPYLDGDQTDMGVAVGLKGAFLEDNHYDVSLSLGSNELDYFLNNTLNQNAPLDGGVAQRDFDTGAFEQSEMNFNVDITRKWRESLHLAYGAEYREETFSQMAGEPNSYEGAGASGMAGVRASDAGDFSRSNYALYADLEHKLMETLGLHYALRFEDFEDFGETINGKLAGRYDMTGDLAFRGAVSTGFHAPTPGQANLRSTTTSFRNGVQYEVGHFPAGHEEVRSLGSQALTEEKALNASVGVVYEMGENVSVTVDYYNIGVDGRIYRADVDSDNDGTEDRSFYTNAMDLNHSGFDVTISSHLGDWLGVDSQVSFAYNMNSVEVTKNRMVQLENGTNVQVVSDSLVEDIENNYPSHNWTITSYTRWTDDWSFLGRGRYIGAHYDQSGTIDGLEFSKEIDPTFYLDFEVGYHAIKNLSLAIGATNILDSYPTTIEDDGKYANMWGAGMPYPRRSAANYEGGAWYLKAAYTF